MTGPKLTAIILFGVLSFAFGALFSLGLNGVLAAIIVGLIMAFGAGVFIYFAKTGRLAFARGFLALGTVCIVVPIAALAGLGEQVANGTLPVLQDTTVLTDHEAVTFTMTEFVVPSLVASAGVVFGMLVGLILVIIGGLMHLKGSQA